MFKLKMLKIDILKIILSSINYFYDLINNNKTN